MVNRGGMDAAGPAVEDGPAVALRTDLVVEHDGRWVSKVPP
jgi:hypothetical protein